MQKNLWIAAAIVLGPAACTSTGTLKSPPAATAIGGTVTRGAFEPYQVEVRLDGKTYRGEWRTSAPTPEQKATTTYPHQKHIGEVRSTLKAGDGSTLDCRWNAHSEKAEGVCTGGGHDYPLVLD